MSKTATMDYETLARGLLRRYRDIEASPGRNTRAHALAHFQGMCDAANRLGIGMTETAVHLTVADVVRSGLGQDEPRPAFHPAGANAELKDYDAQQTAFLANALKAL